MKTFTINSDNNVTVYATRKAATEAQTGIAFTGEDNIAELLGADSKRLIAIYNSLPGVVPVKKFTSSAVASKRILTELQKLEAPAVAEGETAEPAKAPKAPKVAKAKVAKVAKAAKPAKAPKAAKKAKAAKQPKTGTSKKDEVLALISRKNGATLEEIMAATSWQKHTVRGFIAILGKKGTKIESFKSEAGARTYKAA